MKDLKFFMKTSTEPNQPGIRYLGRFDFSSPEGPKCAWSASTILANFYGTSVAARLKSSGENYFTVVLDGKIIIERLRIKGEEIHTLAEGLLEKEHEIRLIRRTEAFMGPVQFLGFSFQSGEILPPPAPSSRRIEIIGDSISCGYGNESEEPFDSFHPEKENAYAAYGSIAARELGAEHMILAWSGLGLMRNYDGSPHPMPDRYPLVLPSKPNKKWDFQSWIPQVVVINLGTNDFYGEYIPDRSAFLEVYKFFLKTIHSNYPDAQILCTLGSMLSDKSLEICREYIEEGVVNAARDQGETWVHFLEFEPQKGENGYGEGYHPSLKTHELMGKQLTEAIKTIMDWEE